MNMDITTLIIIGINVLISIQGFNNPSFFERYMFHIGGIQRGEKIRVMSSAFLHADFSHLLFNMLTLYFFAPYVIAMMGVTSFILVYLVSLLAGNLLSYYFHKNEYNYSAVGASGAVSGVIYAALLLNPDLTLYFFFAIPIPGYIFGIGYLLYSIYGMKNRIGNIGHDAHFGGAVGGFVTTIILDPAVIFSSTLMLGLLLIPIVILIVLKRMGKI